MTKLYTSISASLHYEDDADLIEAIKEFKARGGNISDLIRQLLREYFFGPQIDKVDDKVYYKVIQLENELNDLRDDVLRRINELEAKLNVIKQAIEQKQRESEKESNEDKKLIETIKKAFEDIERDPTILHFVDDPVMAVRARLKAIAEQTGKKLKEIEKLAIEHVPSVRTVLGGGSKYV